MLLSVIKWSVVISKTKYVVSACLAGHKCRYDGEAKTQQTIQELVESGQAIAVCPEQLGGLSTPRPPAEQRDQRVLTNTGKNVTQNFNRGAELALEIACQFNATAAVLKSKSPMCGYGKIYDGTFQGKLINGNGKFTKRLIDLGLDIQSMD